MDETLPPNEKEWTEEHRNMINQDLPGYMTLGETYDIRVGKWFPVEVGGGFRISQIEEEVEKIIEVFDEYGIDVRIPIAGINNKNKATPIAAYKVEIENWEASPIE